MKSRIKVILAERRRTAVEVAAALGISPTRLRNWFTGAGIEGLRMRDAVRLADELGCPVDELFET